MNVILVDDEEVAVNALQRRVNWKKYGMDQVFVANSLRQAQEIFRQNTIDVMISDIEMPQGSGLELFEWVKVYYPAVECVYVTCHPEFDYVRKALQLGSADYLLKPIDYEELDAVLTQLVERCRKPTAVRENSTTLERPGEDRERADAVETVKRYVREHIKEDIYISDIAGQIFLNEQYLMRTFKKATGLSVLEYITQERLRLAQELLAGTDWPIKQVAEAAGYGNYSYFTRLFKRNLGSTPQAYRQEHSGLTKSEVGK